MWISLVPSFKDCWNIWSTNSTIFISPLGDVSLDLTLGFGVGVALAIFHIFNSASFSILEKVVTEKTTFFLVKFFILDEKLILSKPDLY